MRCMCILTTDTKQRILTFCLSVKSIIFGLLKCSTLYSKLCLYIFFTQKLIRNLSFLSSVRYMYIIPMSDCGITVPFQLILCLPKSLPPLTSSQPTKYKMSSIMDIIYRRVQLPVYVISKQYLKISSIKYQTRVLWATLLI